MPQTDEACWVPHAPTTVETCLIIMLRGVKVEYDAMSSTTRFIYLGFSGRVSSWLEVTDGVTDTDAPSEALRRGSEASKFPNQLKMPFTRGINLHLPTKM